MFFNLKRRRWSDLFCQTQRSLPRTQSDSLQMSADFIFEKKVYSVDPGKDRARHISDNSLSDSFW